RAGRVDSGQGCPAPSHPDRLPATASSAACHRERHLVQKPLVAPSRTAPTKLACQQRAELAAPEANGLVAHLDPAFGEQFLDIAVAEGEAVIQPDGITDDLGRESVASNGDTGTVLADTGTDPTSPAASTCQSR